MTIAKRIKVIKREERHNNKQAARSGVRPRMADIYADIAKNDAATIVTSWVRELRRRKVVDPRREFEGLFRKVA